MGKPKLVDAAPAAMPRKRGPGGPRVTVRAHYGALPSMAGRDGRRVGKPAWMASLLAPALGSQVPGTKKSLRWSVRKAHFVTTKGASFGAPSPLKRGDQPKAKTRVAARGREAVAV